MDDNEQFEVYNTLLQGNPIVSKYCTIKPELLASYCTFVIKRIAEENKEYEQMYLDYPTFTTNDPNSDKCRNKNLFIPVYNEYVGFKHLICHGRPIIIRTDEPDEKFSEKISIYIVDNYNLLILEKIDEESHRLLKFISSNISCIILINGVLTIPSPESTFYKKIIKYKMDAAECIPHYEENENHILKNIDNNGFKRICYMLFSRAEYENKVKLLPKKKIRQMRKRIHRSKCFLWHYSRTIKFKVTMYTCPIFEEIFTFFKLMAGPDPNSVIVIKLQSNCSGGRPYELIENISLEHLNIQVRL